MPFGIKIYSILSVIYSLYMFSIVANPNVYHAPYMIRAGYILIVMFWMVFGIGILKRYAWARIGLIATAILSLVDYVTYPPKEIISSILDRTIRPTWVLGVIFFASLIIFFMRPKIKQQFEIADATQKTATNKRQTLLREKTKEPLVASMKQQPLLFMWTILKLSWIYILYLRFGGKERFYITKANCYVDLQWYNRAIISYERALMESDRAAVHSMLGFCYDKIQEYDNSVEHYRKAYKKRRNRSADIGLAVAEYQLGNIDKSDEVIQELCKSNFAFELEDKKILDALEAKIAIAKKAQDGMAE